MNGEGDFLVALMTAPNREEARRIAEALVVEGLAACCTLIDGTESIYRWNGAVERATETLVVIKTDRERFGRLRDRVLELHPYDVPELIAMPIVAGSDQYLQWLGESLAPL
ncbi:MAG: divalent-cation tolerance protein CutA [Candidatus Kapaibacterium sp.]